MALKKMCNDLKKSRPARKCYQIKPNIRVDADTRRFRFYILPTILYVPWIYRHPNVGLGVVEIKWLNFTIVIGEFVTKGTRGSKKGGE